MLFGLFSFPVSAATGYPYQVQCSTWIQGNDGVNQPKYTFTVLTDPTDEATQEKSEYVYVKFLMYETIKMNASFRAFYTDKSKISKANSFTRVTLSNCLVTYLFDNPNNDNKKTFYLPAETTAKLKVVYTDGSVDTFTTTKITRYSDGTFNLDGEFNPKKDVADIEFVLDWEIPYWDLLSYSAVIGTDPNTGHTIYNTLIYVTIGERELNSNQMELDIQSEEAGLLSSIIGWISNIFDKISDTFDAIVDGFAEVGQFLADLPGKIWEFIENGLKMLFVPTDAQLEDLWSRFNTFLSDKFGCIYQVCDIVWGVWESIEIADATGSVEFPDVAITFTDFNGEAVQFNYWFGEVDIVPANFEFVAEICKTVAGIICSVAFVGGLRKRYDEVMGVEQ